ncbi:MAG: isocitrate/isopropylmalate dehydrogenase family protein [Planctomycetota bacterium]|nr:MAG: isocitrate/isopropylmalate dehydrogenase family protein [Planctomycetota bacterium]
MPKDSYHIVVLPGDGIGPEVISHAQRILRAVESASGVNFDFEEIPCGGHYYLKHEKEWPDGSLDRCRAADAILLGAVGHQVDGKDVFTKPGRPYPTSRLAGYAQVIGNRQNLDLYANVRPIRLYPSVKTKISNQFKEVWNADMIDYVIVRENTEGAYTSETVDLEENGKFVGRGTMIRATRKATERIVRFACNLARDRNQEKRVTCCDKANVIGAHSFFREIFTEIASNEFPDIERDYAYFDAFCQWQLRSPENYDVVVTTNLVGDVISDNGAIAQGGLGFAAGGNIGNDRAMFEPIHGSAPKYTGMNKVNPTACILACNMMLEWLGDKHGDPALTEASKRLDESVAEVWALQKAVTYDQGGSAKGSDVAEAIEEAFLSRYPVSNTKSKS